MPEDFPAGVFPRAERRTLSNGLEVLVVERRAVPAVDLSLQLDAGYTSDRTSLAGAASLAMDMLDEGTSQRSALEISDELARLGATLATDAQLDISTVSMSALAENLEASLDLFADVILRPAFAADEVERRKKQRIAAIQREKAQPVTMALRVLPRLLYGEEHVYGLPFTGSGTEDSVAAITRDVLLTITAPGSSRETPRSSPSAPSLPTSSSACSSRAWPAGSRDPRRQARSRPSSPESARRSTSSTSPIPSSR